MDTICLNGEFLALEEARVSASDGGLLLGDGVFETMRVELGQVLHADAHFARLSRGVRLLEIPFRVEPHALMELCEQVLDANGLRDARMRITVTRGPMRNQPIASSEGEPTLLIAATRLDARVDEARARGWRLAVAPNPRNHRSPLSTVKTTSYLESTFARRHAVRLGFDEALMLNAEGMVAECAMANVFVVSDGRVSTPRIEDGALPGVMRAAAIDACAELGIPCREETLALEDVVSASEVFATNAIVQVLPVVQMGERAIGSGQPGAVAMRVFECYRRRVAKMVRASRG